MAFSSEGVEHGIGLALSGGGFRATLFHLGALWRLNEISYLPKLDRISSVSGGSVTAGFLGLNWSKLQFSSEVATNFLSAIVEPLRCFCALGVDFPVVLKGMMHPFKSASDMLEKAYRKHLFGDATLQSLPDRPRFVFNATNFDTGVSFRFSRPYAGDYRIGLMEKPTLRLALAVTASSAFPPVLSPVVIKPDPISFKKTEGADLFDQEEYRRRLVLTDGGVYDNLGLETVWNRYNTVLASDAGAPFNTEWRFGTLWTKQAFRVVDIITNQARALRKRALIDSYQRKARHGTYWGILTDIKNYQLDDALPCRDEKRRELASIRTRLNRFTESEQCELINWGYALCDAAMRRHVVTGPAPPSGWPYPDFALG